MNDTRRPFRRLSLALALVALLAAGADAADTLKPFSLKTPGGDVRTLADFPGKATLVVFFFPTCAYCEAAFPHVRELFDRYHDQGLGMVWINVVPKEDPLVAEWVGKHGADVPVLVGATERIQRDYGLRMTPTYALVDAAGKVLFRHAGHRPGDEKKLDAGVRKALALPE